jgi:hypothetical protein
MNIRHRISARSPRPLVLLAAGLIVLSLSSISCRQIADPVGNSPLTAAGQTLGQCMDQCNADAVTRVNQQAKVHNILIYLCKGNASCIANENARYAGVLAQIEADRIACIAQCHHQGGATAGH